MPVTRRVSLRLAVTVQIQDTRSAATVRAEDTECYCRYTDLTILTRRYSYLTS